MKLSGHRAVVFQLGIAQTLAWASSYYLPALLAGPLALDLGLPATTVFGAFTLALVVSALVGPFAGRAIDVFGGRRVLMSASVLFAAGLAYLGTTHTEWQLWAAWIILGLAMGGGLYDAAFATVVGIFPVSARISITGITLVAGFASTVGWPLTAWWIDAFGWRGACLVWASLHVLVGIPLLFALPRSTLETLAPVTLVGADHVEAAPREVPGWVGMAMAGRCPESS